MMMQPAEIEKENQRRAICEELGVSYSAVMESFRASVLLDRLIELRLAMPPQIVENLTLIERAWTEDTKGIQ